MRRATGLALAPVSVGFIGLATVGHLLPPEIASRPVDLTRLIVYLGIDTNAILGTPLRIAVLSGVLANAGLCPDDVEQVLVPNLIRGVDEFIAGNVDAGFFAIGPATVAEAAAAVGNIRFLNEGAAAPARLQEAVPSSYIATVQPTQATMGVEAPLPTMHYNYAMFVNADPPDDLVYDLTRILAEKSEDMAASLPLFRLLDPAETRKDFGVAFHPGAIRYSEEKGVDQTKLRS